MSDDESISTPAGVFLRPQRTIGAQDILVIEGVSHHGFLRQCGKLERIVENAFLLKFVCRELAKWRQRFVVLARGCLYVYTDEYATNPTHSASLRGYDKVERCQDSNQSKRNSFCIKSCKHAGMKEFLFCPATDNDRKMWMKKFRKEIQKANEAEEDVEDNYEDEYAWLETPMPSKTPEGVPKLPPRPNKKAHSVQIHNKDVESSDEDDYDQIVEPTIRTTGPAVKPKPKPGKKRPTSRDEYEFAGSDRSQVDGILKLKPIGTYLVRQSRAGDNQVLSVCTNEGTKEYKIFCKESQFSIDHKKCFATIDELVANYYTDKLPNRSDSLIRGYSCMNHHETHQ